MARQRLTDSLGMAEWQALRATQAGDVVGASEAGDLLSGGAGADVIGAPKLGPSQLGASQQSDLQGARAAGEFASRAVNAIRRGLGGMGNVRPPQPARSASVPRPVYTKRDAARDFGAALVMEQISAGEGAPGEGGYDVTFGGGRYYPPDWPRLTDLTLDEVTLLQSEIRKRGGQSPVGKYQFMPNTLSDLRKSLRLSGQEKFSPELQDRLMRERMRYRGYDDFLDGKIDSRRLQENFAKEWRSIEYDSGRTFDGQHLGTKTQQIQSAFGSAKAETERLSRLGRRPGGAPWR